LLGAQLLGNTLIMLLDCMKGFDKEHKQDNEALMINVTSQPCGRDGSQPRFSRWLGVWFFNKEKGFQQR
jgi:hypothetical protein